MPALADAQPEQVAAIYRESHAVWGAGLTPENYSGLWDEISRTPWAQRFARFLVWVDEPQQVLSSLKLYRPLVRVLGRTARTTVLSAIFTPRAFRRLGHARDMVRAVLERGRAEGDHVTLLFSDIGTAYYSVFGFRPLAAREQWGPLPRRCHSSGEDYELRPMRTDDQPAIRRAHDASARGRRLAMIRDADHWKFLQVRSRSYFARLHGSDVRQHWRVALRDGRFAGYLVTVEGRSEWNVREIGSAEGDPRTIAAILRAGAVGARRSGLRRFYGWIPPEVIGCLEEWKIRSGPRRRALPMIRSLDESLDLDPLESPPAVYIPYHDQF